MERCAFNLKKFENESYWSFGFGLKLKERNKSRLELHICNVLIN